VKERRSCFFFKSLNKCRLCFTWVHFFKKMFLQVS
jgi:hypothetical protein